MNSTHVRSLIARPDSLSLALRATRYATPAKQEFTPKMLLGCLLAMAGFLLYSQTKIQKIRTSSSAVERVDGLPSVLPSISREASSGSFEREPLTVK